MIDDSHRDKGKDSLNKNDSFHFSNAKDESIPPNISESSSTNKFQSVKYYKLKMIVHNEIYGQLR